MEQWWKQRHVSRRDWILDHLEDLALTCEESMVVLLIDFMNDHQMMINHGVLSNKLKMEREKIDDLLTSLTAKGFLEVKLNQGKVSFCIDGVFDLNTSGTNDGFDASLFELFEDEFSRTLSAVEVERLSQWAVEYDQKLIFYALREAMTNNKRSFDYIERILMEWKRRNFTSEQYEEGKR